MKKVVVERPRWGSRQSNRKFGVRLKYVDGHDYEEQPKKPHGFESCADPRFAKEFTDVLGPLKRFLHRNAGRPWDKVYSELCAGLDKRKLTGLHIFLHVDQFVEKDCYFGSDGKPYHLRYGKEHPVRWFYVHPRTRLLCEAPPQTTKREYRRAAALAEEITLLRLDGNTGYRKHEGIWYRVKLKRIFVDWRARPVKHWNIFLKQDVTLGNGEHWVSTEKEQCNRAQLKEVQRLLAERLQRIRKM